MNDEDQTYEDLSPDEMLNAENELELLRLNLEYGAESYIDDDTPPEVVSMFLKQIRTFEENMKSGEGLTTIQEVLADLEPVDASQHSEEEIEELIEAFLNLLLENGILIDRPDHISPLEYYQFLTTVLVRQPIMKERPEGFAAGYIYDEMVFDAPHFAEQNAIECIDEILDLENPYDGIHLYDLVAYNDQDFISKAEFISLIEEWSEDMEYLDLELLEVDSVIDVGKSKKTVFVTIDYAYALTDDDENTEDFRHDGLAVVEMELINKNWVVTYLKVPGILD